MADALREALKNYLADLGTDEPIRQDIESILRRTEPCGTTAPVFARGSYIDDEGREQVLHVGEFTEPERPLGRTRVLLRQFAAEWLATEGKPGSREYVGGRFDRLLELLAVFAQEDE